MMHAIQLGPVVGFVNVNLMRFYGFGVFAEKDCSKETNQAVLIIGYGKVKTPQGTKKYWMIQNYWGVQWGERGFMRILRGKTECGIGKEGFFPIIKK